MNFYDSRIFHYKDISYHGRGKTYLPFFTNESKKFDNGTLCFVVVGVDSILIMTFVGLR